ncbi:hypothetical protein C3L33_21856, partial [Rhododendron williamsianum]
MPSIDLHSLLLFSAVLRLLLILYGEWQDTHMEVRYTDVDYLVFSDAASLMASGKSPYERTTYRYSPLIAFLVIPNSMIHRSWGKFVFSASDLLVGLFIHNILKLQKVPENLCSYSVMTVAFVAFNKVIRLITAQYFVWFFCLLPLILPWSNMKLKWNGLSSIFIWMGAQIHWLIWGYLLEFKGKNVFLQLWAASLIFLAANTFVLIKIILCHRFSPLFKQLGPESSKGTTKHE